MRHDPMRALSTLEIDAFDWDIVWWFGGLCVVCEGPAKNGEPRLSSGIVAIDGKHLSSPDELKAVGDGTRLSTQSGNTYVLHGERTDRTRKTGTDSVFPQPPPPPSWRQRWFPWIFGGK